MSWWAHGRDEQSSQEDHPCNTSDLSVSLAFFFRQPLGRKRSQEPASGMENENDSVSMLNQELKVSVSFGYPQFRRSLNTSRYARTI